MVYDLLSDCPARIQDILLLGLTREEAERHAGRANEILSVLQPKAPPRFAAMQDPCDDWLVCDLVFDLSAELEDLLLIGLARSDAEELAGLANAGIIRPTGYWSVPFASVA
ncbi:hypothetical protein [Mesorhizobium sp. WSM3859]|uniref:hypothetical protein n=1 Tax=Mesorhizobium sp. WSM3859 TaxID=2029402 RepID=UPI000BC3C076|nr:hypothetical protein [Mesorhizobium sp. WSM3859]PBC06542.1 hypothetical protein CK230_31230 [Mesorhizobium sp. WSM3859]